MIAATATPTAAKDWPEVFVIDDFEAGLDKWENQDAGRLESFGRPGFRRYVTLRAFARRTRARVESLLGRNARTPTSRRTAP